MTNEMKTDDLVREQALSLVWGRILQLPYWTGLVEGPISHHVQMFTSGSYRLGIYGEQTDIDLVVVTTCQADRVAFTLALKTDLSHCPDVTELNHVAEARVPLLSFRCLGIDFDVSVATLNLSHLPSDPLEVLSRAVPTADRASELALGGPIHTQCLAGRIKNLTTFRALLSRVREWAKTRGLYGAKYGYLGGVSWCIMAAFVACRFPASTESESLRLFFRLFQRWNWKDRTVSLQVLPPDAELESSPIRVVTPCAPVINASSSMTFQHLWVLREELDRAVTMMGSNDPLQPAVWSALATPKRTEDMGEAYRFHLTVSWSDVSVEQEGYLESRLVGLARTITQHTGAIAVLWPFAHDHQVSLFIKPSLAQIERGETVTLMPTLLEWQRRLLPGLDTKLKYTLDAGKKKKKRKVKA